MHPGHTISGKHVASLMLTDYVQKLNIAPADANSMQDGRNRKLFSRTWTFGQYVKPMLDQYLAWFEGSKEQSNFTYGLTPLNELQLAGMVDAATHCGIAQAQAYFAELNVDSDLVDHVNRMTLQSPLSDVSDLNQGYGRRLGWYAFIRATKPGVVIETGVDKGLGACVIASALLKNIAEGFPGKYYGTDINPQAGYLFTAPYARVGKILYGDSLTSLATLDERIDLFINDSDHSASYEAEEYRAIHAKLSPGAIVLGDNSHCSPSLFEYALAHQKQFLFFGEKPRNHFYPGAGIGICY